MDCCNYVPYRHPVQYYGYYQHEALPHYHGDYFGHQNVYHEYYRNAGPYYDPQHWQGDVYGAPDYVYNPKEARIRKAMREAANRERDRAIGSSTMLARPSARRASQSHGWTPAAHEDLMMSPLPMRAGPDSPRYPAPAPVNGHADPFLVPGAGYAAAKMRQEAVSHNAGYSMQPNPLTQLHQQTEMWHNFQDELRPRPGNPFMLPEEIPSSYSHHQPSPPLSIPSPHMPTGQTPNHMPTGQTPNHMSTGQTPNHMPTGQTPNHMSTGQTPQIPIGQTPNMPNGQPPHPLHSLSAISMPMTPPYANENVPPDEWTMVREGESKGEQRGMYGEERSVDGGQQSHQIQQQLQLQPQPQQADKTDSARSFKKLSDSSHPPPCPAKTPLGKQTLYLPLSCMKFCASPDLFANNVEYQKEYIAKYFQNSAEYEILHLATENGGGFPYATAVSAAGEQPGCIQGDAENMPIVIDNKNILDWSGVCR